jgi:hypothetical protein
LWQVQTVPGKRSRAAQQEEQEAQNVSDSHTGHLGKSAISLQAGSATSSFSVYKQGPDQKAKLCSDGKQLGRLQFSN